MTNEQRVSLVAHGLDELPERHSQDNVNAQYNGHTVTLTVKQGNQERFIEMSLQQAETALIELFGAVLSSKEKGEI